MWHNVGCIILCLTTTNSQIILCSRRLASSAVSPVFPSCPGQLYHSVSLPGLYGHAMQCISDHRIRIRNHLQSNEIKLSWGIVITKLSSNVQCSTYRLNFYQILFQTNPSFYPTGSGPDNQFSISCLVSIKMNVSVGLPSQFSFMPQFLHLNSQSLLSGFYKIQKWII